jgi:PKD repeat protein
MQRFTVVLIGLILLIFTFQANAESPFIYGIHDLDSNPQEYDALPPNSAIVNGGFEGADDGSGVGQGWTAFSSEGYGPDWDVVDDSVHDGGYAQEVFSPQPSTNDKFAGIYQVVATNPGTSYVIRAWNQTYFPGGHQWDHIARLGLDLTGGTDFRSGSVTWYEFDSAKQIWHQLEITATATGSAMTVFLQSWHKWATGGDALAWFDDIQVTADGVEPPDNQNPLAVISAAPTSGTAPLAVTFNGSGSSDPDGDDLSYAWDFGDGAQASGAGVQYSYLSQGTYTAALTVNDGKGGSNTASVVITVTDVDPPPGNRAPQAVFTASPRTGKAPLTVAFDASGSSDPDGDSLTFSWHFDNGSQGSGSSVTHTFQSVGSYSTILTVSDGRGGGDTSSMVISVTSGDIPMPGYCPSALNFDEIRSQLNQQGHDLAHVKIGFHVGPAGNANGLGDWMRCLDAAGVPFFIKSADSAGQIWEAAQLKAASGVPHVLVYRKSIGDGWSWDVPDYNKNPYDAALEHWQRQRDEFPPELEQYKHLIWLETINEVDKNRSEWLGEFAYHTALIAMEQGFNWAGFGWSSGEPEREHWEGPWMQKFLQLAGQYPDRVAVALHEYSYVQENLDRFYPHLVGRFQMLFDVCDANGIPRPTVVVTEFGWVYDDIADSVQQAMEVDLPWAAELYAQYPQVLGASIWYLGPGFGGIANKAQPLIAPMTAYSLQNYFVIPQESSTPDGDTTTTDGDSIIGEVGWINDTLDHRPQTIFLEHSYRNPVVFAQALSQDGGDTAVVRITDVQSGHFSLYLQEAPNKDGWHTPEAVSYLVLEAGSWELDDGARMEVGTVDTGATVGYGIGNVWQEITFPGPFSAAPVIFSQVQGAGDPHWVKTRQRNAGPVGFEVAMEEEEHKTSPHGQETIGWMAIEAGTGIWNGHPYEAALTPDAVTHAWHSVTFRQNFVEAPRLITSLATFDGGDSAHLRYDRTSLTADGVAIRVEEDTAWDAETAHTTERVSILAIEQSGLLTASEFSLALE